MVKRDLATRKIGRARAYLADAEVAFLRSCDAFAADRKERDLASFYLFLAIQECIDLAAHWIADDGLPPADDYGAGFELLAQHGRIDPPLAHAMAAAAGLRNLIAHGYSEIDPGRVHDEAQAGIPALRVFMDAVARSAGA